MIRTLIAFFRIKRELRPIPLVTDAYQEMRERHAREIFARIQASGCIVNDDSEVDGIRYGDLQRKGEQS